MDSDQESLLSEQDNLQVDDDMESDFEEGDAILIDDQSRVPNMARNYSNGWTSQLPNNHQNMNPFHFQPPNVQYIEQTESQWIKSFMSPAIIQM